MVNRSSKKKTCIISFERNKDSAVIKHMHAAVSVLTRVRPAPPLDQARTDVDSC